MYSIVNIKRSKYPDIIITPDNILHIYNNLDATIDEFIKFFPTEKNKINNFFNLIVKYSIPQLFSVLKNKTFKDLLDNYFKDDKLKTILKSLLGYIGMPSSITFAFTAVVLYREFVINGRYLVEGGIQNLSNALLEIFKKNGGDIIFSTKVNKIIINNRETEGVIINKNIIIKSKYIVANCDMKQVYLELIDSSYTNPKFIEELKKRKVCPSAFIVYLGVNNTLSKLSNKFYSLWYLSSYNIDDFYLKIFNKEIYYTLDGILYCSPSLSDPSLAPVGKNILAIYIRAAYNNAEYWNNMKYTLSEEIIKKTEKIIPNLSKEIVVKEIATPNTFYKFTLNHHGTTNGWAPTLFQFHSMDKNVEYIKGLFFAGHWSAFPPMQGGADTAIYSGKRTAKTILNYLNK